MSQEYANYLWLLSQTQHDVMPYAVSSLATWRSAFVEHAAQSSTLPDPQAAREPYGSSNSFRRKQRRRKLRQALLQDTSTSASASTSDTTSVDPEFLADLRKLGYELYAKDVLEAANKVQFDELLLNLLPHTLSLADDAKAYVVIQKLFTLGNLSQRVTLAKQLHGSIVQLALSAGGCRSVQRALESLPPEQQTLLVVELRTHVVECAEHPHGNFVLQKCMEVMQPESLVFMAAELSGRVKRLSGHEYGCRVIQRILEYWPGPMLEGIRQEILQSVAVLSEDRYGNYVVQSVLQHGQAKDQKAIIREIRDRLVHYSVGKFSSRVVEKCFEVAHSSEHGKRLESEQTALIETLTGATSTVGGMPLNEMINDEYGNYVVQQAIRCSEGRVRRMLIGIVESQSPEHVRRPTATRRVLAAIKQETQQGAMNEAAPVSTHGGS
eukprot:gnl/TRDRNA2_/TRDRNA2_81036_c0_seq1.p1 gnl/TRDRNA2_/TRDRNA2_81036_c0~~gnl/TRDRNA2_/TRDRNA2_81036_c0_seq1.p1  ORF type:complete len:438 (+),score=90.42 gnl/TRDRNA2_/TRDRNA2_81036_c0_seq1:78-1391(+)